MTSQTLDAPVAMPPSLLPMVVGDRRGDLVGLQVDARERLIAAIGNPEAAEADRQVREHGRLPVADVATTVLVFGSAG